MMRVAVVDDEPLARSGVMTRLAAHADVVLAGVYADATAALAGLALTPADVVFVDVQMPGMNGIEMLAAMAPVQRPLAILLTAHDSFAVRAFELQAIDYLLKPIDDDRFGEALQRAREALALRGRSALALASPLTSARTSSWLKRFSVRTGRRVIFVDVASVEWIEADGDYAVLHSGGRTHLLRESLQQLATQLDPRRFLRVHRSAIVRIDCVAELQPLSNRDAMLRLRDGTPLRASRTYVPPLLDALRGRVP